MASISESHNSNMFFSSVNIPYIIGMGLMGFVIIILTISLIACYCTMKKKYEAKINSSKDSKDYNIPLENIKTIKNVTDHSVSKNPFERLSIPLPNIERLDYASDINFGLRQRSHLNSIRNNRYRRGSVPASLSTLYEDNVSLESGKRKKSLSSGCVNNISLGADMPESGPSASFEVDDNTKKFNFKDDIDKRYSIYDDRLLTGDDKFSKYGKLYFSVHYNYDAKTLLVSVKKAQHLSGFRFKGKNRFYIKLSLKKCGLRPSDSTLTLSGVPKFVKPICTVSNKKKEAMKRGFRTSIQADFCNPNFEENFTFVCVDAVILQENVLEFTIKEETPRFLEKNRVLGFVEFVLRDAALIERHESLSELVRDIVPVEQQNTGDHAKGRMLLALQYNSAVSVLSVAVRELRSPDMLGLHWPATGSSVKANSGGTNSGAVSVHLYLRSIDDVIHSHKVVLGPAQGAEAAPMLLCPSQETPVKFPLDSCFLNSVCLILVVFARVRNCSKTPLGRVVVGPIRFADGPGLRHWVAMSVDTDQPVLRSHEII